MLQRLWGRSVGLGKGEVAGFVLAILINMGHINDNIYITFCCHCSSEVLGEFVCLSL